MKNAFFTAALAIALTSATLALPRPVGKDQTYVVQERDTIYTISRKYGLAPDHILWANGLSHKHLPKTGDRLLIPLRRIPPFTPPESTAIVLNLPERMLYLFRDHKLAAYWGVAIGGEQYPTPDGTFHILDKEKDPTWEPPAWLEREPIGPGPENPLGDRWLQITKDMVGIHGTNNPDSIGGVASLGCVRLYPEAIRALYDQVSVGTPVYSIYEQVRVGEEPDGTLVWSFFPDPYTRYYATYQAEQGLAQARSEGFDGEMTHFEIEEREKNTNGLITPVFGVPLTVKAQGPLPEIAAIAKSTGNWLNPEVLEKRGFTVSESDDGITITSPAGKQARVVAAKVPLNPYRLPRTDAHEVLKLEGHKWRAKIWVPMRLVLDYFQMPYKWEANSNTLILDPTGYASADK